MTAETEDLVLELLRGMRADMDRRFTAVEARFTAIDDRLAGIEERIEAIGTPLEGIRSVIVASVGSLVEDMKGHDARIAKLEGAHA